MAREWLVPSATQSIIWSEDGEEEILVGEFILAEDQAAAGGGNNVNLLRGKLHGGLLLGGIL